MAGGDLLSDPTQPKIKGGKWTVARFFLVSTAYTSVWLAVSSQLGYYKTLHGPQVLLQLNIAYFLPSIPLLVVSAFLDRPLERWLGVARTVLCRLVVGLVGYAAVCVAFPFLPTSIWWLLGAVVALGLFSGIAYSASYQLVARFANKNVIALGLGCAASGPLVLVLQIALQLGREPTRKQQIYFYETIALIILGGLWATVSLLWRHWDAIEGHGQQQRQGSEAGGGSGGLAEPLLGQEEGAVGAGLGAELPSRPLAHQASLPALVLYSALEPYETFLSEDQEWPLALGRSGSREPPRRTASSSSLLGSRASGLDRAGLPPPLLDASSRRWSAPAEEEEAAALLQLRRELSARLGPQGQRLGHQGPPLAEDGKPQPAGAGPGVGGSGAQQQQQQAGRGPGPLAATLRAIWPALAALFVSSFIALTVFPFFTYVPSSGLMGDTLPKVLFFVRIGADLLGRFLPRLRLLAAESPFTPLAVCGIKLTAAPLFFLYLKSPPRMHSDVAITAFVCALWLLGGYVNTMANVLAPRLVPPELKGRAAGLMAIAYQLAHFGGLSAATLLAVLLFGKIHVDG